MGVITGGIHGNVSKKVGNHVFSVVNGQNVVRMKPHHVANPNTPAQQAQRRRMSRMSKSVAFIASLVKIGFKNLDPGQTGRSRFMSVNFDECTDNGTVSSINLPGVVASEGSLLAPDLSTEPNSTNSGEIIFGINDNSGSANAEGSDILKVGYLANDYSTGGVIASTLTRGGATGSQTVVLPQAARGKTIQLFYFFVSANGTKVSGTSTESKAVPA